MTGSGRSDAAAEDPKRAAERRRRRAAVFGDVLPETTEDDRDPSYVGSGGSDRASDPAGDSASDAWLRSNVPPHHGGG